MSSIFESGRHAIGFNYWGSHAGTDMWNNWREDVLREDVHRLADAGATVLRVFPNWRDFQPLRRMRACFGVPRFMYCKEQPLGHDEAGAAGVDPVMLERFEIFTAICRENGIQLIVSMLTGWMSGRLFVPEALEGRNVLTDPFCLYWETKFVECFVKRFRDNDAIAAWELGNECNCMGEVENPEQAWLWTYTVAAAIRRQDASRPVISGMHSLTPNGDWTMQHQAEACDLLTPHPYPVFTPYCNLDPHVTAKPVNHLAAELTFYREIGGKPGFTEEIGTTDLRIDEKHNADFVRANLWNALAYNGFPLLWWCGMYERDLNTAPYTWGAGERGMGLAIPGGGEKLALNEFRKFKALCDALPFERLPERKIQAVSILSAKDSWAAHFGCFLLSQQAGFSVECQMNDQALKDAEFYLCPSFEYASKEQWEELQQRVRDGATLFVSANKEMGTGYDQMFGFRYDLLWGQPSAYVWQGNRTECPVSKQMEITDGEVLLRDDNGQPLLIRSHYGKGATYFCPLALEADYAVRSETAYTDVGAMHRAIYDVVAKSMNLFARKERFLTGITEHWFDENRAALVAVNYDTQAVTEHLTVPEGFAVTSADGQPVERTEDGRVRLSLGHNDGCVLMAVRS